MQVSQGTQNTDYSGILRDFINSFVIPDVEFGRVQARDMLQHLWTGPISNSAVEVVQVFYALVLLQQAPFDGL